MELNNFYDYLALWLLLSGVVGMPFAAYRTCHGQGTTDAISEVLNAAFWVCVLTWAVRRLFF